MQYQRKEEGDSAPELQAEEQTFRLFYPTLNINERISDRLQDNDGY